MRAWLSSLGIIIGVFSVIVLLSLGEGSQQNILSSIQSLGTNLLTILPWWENATDVRGAAAWRNNRNVFKLTDAQLIEKIPGVAAVSPQINGSRQLIYGSKNTSTTVFGVLPSYLNVRNVKVAFGSFISSDVIQRGEKVVVLGTTVAKNLFWEENPLGKDIQVGKVFFTVIGVMEEQGQSAFTNGDNAVFIPLPVASKRVFGTEYLSLISVSVTSSDTIDQTKEDITNALLRQFNIKNPDDANFSLLDQNQILETISSITAVFKGFLWGIAAISLLVGGIGVMNIMLVSVTERTREIGIRKAVGAMKKDIILQFLTESILLTLLGGVIGIILSLMIVALLNNFWVTSILTSGMIFLAFFFSVTIGIAFGILPAYKAAQLNPIDALRFE